MKHTCHYEPDLNPTYLELAQHYGVAVIPARVRRPCDKAEVEVGVQLEQLNNPKYTELSFEERLALLVDREVTHRQDQRLQRLMKLAAIPQSATLEDLDLSAARGLEHRFILELAQGNWIDQHLYKLRLQ